jgi:hypothetical protein
MCGASRLLLMTARWAGEVERLRMDEAAESIRMDRAIEAVTDFIVEQVERKATSAKRTAT